MKRSEVFARDGYRCVYCGGTFEAPFLSIDHVQPRVRGGDGSGGNVVTACMACNTAKASRPLAQYLLEHPAARRNFFMFARYVWARHLIAVAEELARRGAVLAPADFVEGVRGLRGSEAIASFLQDGRWYVPTAGDTPAGHAGGEAVVEGEQDIEGE